MLGLVDTYVTSVTNAQAARLERGQLCWAPAFYMPPSLQVLEPYDLNPRDERLNKYKLLSNPPASTLFDHPPVKELGLRDDEEMVVVKAKRRPVAVVSADPGLWVPGRSRLGERVRICVPLYSFQPDDDREFRERVSRHEYSWWLYMPPDGSTRIREGFFRIDRTQVIPAALLDPMPVGLSDDALFVLTEWLRFHVTGQIDDDLLKYREMLLHPPPGGSV